MDQVYSLLLSIAAIMIWLIKTTIYIAIGLFFSWILFKLKEPIIHTLDRIIELLSSKASLFYNKFSDFNKKYIKEPWASVRLYLHNNKTQHYKNKIEQITAGYLRQSESLGSLSKSVDEDFNDKFESIEGNIDSLTLNQNQINFESVLEKASGHQKKLGSLIYYILLTTFMVSINVLLLGLFFNEILPGLDDAVFGRGTLRWLRYSHLVALMFGLIEVGTGVLQYNTAVESKKDPMNSELSTKRISIWIVLTILALVEFIAFGYVSVNSIDMAQQFNITSDNAFYFFIQYFLAFFGIGVTIFEYLLGYWISKSFDDLREYNKTQKPLKDLKKTYDHFQQDLVSYDNNFSKLNKLLSNCRKYVSKISKNIENAISFDNNYGRGENLVTIQGDNSIEESIKYTIRMPENISVTKNETYSYILVNTFFAFIWGFLFYVTTTIMHSIIEAMGNEAFSTYKIGGFTVYALLIAIVLSVAGYFIQVNLRGDTYIDEENRSKVSKTSKFFTYSVGIIIIVLISAFSVYGTGVIQESNLISIAIGILTPVSLYLISFYINRYFFSLTLIIKTVSLFIISVLMIWLLSCISFLSWIITSVVKYIYELAASPGMVVADRAQGKQTVNSTK